LKSSVFFRFSNRPAKAIDLAQDSAPVGCLVPAKGLPVSATREPPRIHESFSRAFTAVVIQSSIEENFQHSSRLPRLFNHLDWLLICLIRLFLPGEFGEGEVFRMARNKVIGMGNKLEQLESGDTVRVSGFYVSNHRECRNSDVWVRRNHQLPVCSQCGKSSTFRLQFELKHVGEDPDFG
jgi:hypothetical protein